METTNKDFIATTERLLGKLGSVTRLIDRVSEHLLPRTSARAAGIVCYSYCGAYCDHYGDKELIIVAASSQADCNSGNTWLADMGCQCF